MKAPTSWITYRTRFLIQAKQLTTNLCFTDALGRQHSGSKGDYLVESSGGAFRITPRQIFEDIYVPLLSTDSESTAPKLRAQNAHAETPAPRIASRPARATMTHVGTAALDCPPEQSSAARVQHHLG